MASSVPTTRGLVSFFFMSSSINFVTFLIKCLSSGLYITQVTVPIVVACYSVIKNEHNPVNIEEITLPIRQQCQEIEICIEWSAPWLSDISWLVSGILTL